MAVDTQFNRRVEDRHPPVPLGELRVEIRTLSDNVAKLTAVVDENTRQLNRLAVLETNHNHQGEALGRAFKDVEALQKEFCEHVKNNETEHKGYSKYVWITTGFCIAVSVLWTVVGYRINAQVDEMMKVMSESRVHSASDKINTEEDVRKVVEKMK